MRCLLLLSFAAFAFAGCRETSTSPSPSRSSSTEPPPVVTAIGVEVARVTWPAREHVDRAALARMSAQAAAKIGRAPVPVMVPNRPDLLSHGEVITEPAFYAFVASLDGMNFSVQGTRLQHRSAEAPSFERSDTVRGTGAMITETDGIWTASWIEYGVAYVASVECGRAEDPRCQGKGFIRELVDALVFVGGDELAFGGQRGAR